MKCRLIGAALLLGASFAYSQSEGNYARYPQVTSGTVTEVDTGTGLTGGPITGTGTISLVTPVTTANGGTNQTTWTAGAIPYLLSTSQFGQDPGFFNWDGVNHRLGVDTLVPAAALDVASGRFQVSNAGNILKINNLTTFWPAVQGTTGTFLRNNGAGVLTWATAASLATGLTAGSVPFVSAAATNPLTDDNANFFWDATNKRLGIGTAAPSTNLHVFQNAVVGTSEMLLENAAPTSFTMIGVKGDVQEYRYGVGGSAAPSGAANKFFLYDNNAGQFRWAVDTAGNFGINTLTPGAKFEIHDGHQKSTQTTAPTAAPTANAGTGATCTVANATDSAGIITLGTTATLPAAGDQCDVTFNAAYGVAPICVVTPNNAQAANDGGQQHQIYFTTSTTALSVNFGAQPNAITTYKWSYHCIETQ